MTLLQNQYRLDKELGQGGFGKTYLATDTHSPSNRQCVVKELIWNGDPEMADQVRKRFVQEALMLQGLWRGSQGGIPELYAYFSENGNHYLVQEWIDGETLTQKLKREGPQTEEATVRLLLGALRVLDYIHTCPVPIIHRDLKPDNIMLRRATGQVVLIDFGVVKVVTGDQTTIMAGTKGYMPTEQVAGRPTFTSDLYALAMTAITMPPASIHIPFQTKVAWNSTGAAGPYRFPGSWLTFLTGPSDTNRRNGFHQPESLRWPSFKPRPFPCLPKRRHTGLQRFHQLRAWG